MCVRCFDSQQVIRVCKPAGTSTYNQCCTRGGTYAVAGLFLMSDFFVPSRQDDCVEDIVMHIVVYQWTVWTHLHCSMPTIGDAAFVSHAVSSGDALCRDLSNILGGAWLLAERQVHRGLGSPNSTCGSPSIWSSLLNDNLLWSCTTPSDWVYARLEDCSRRLSFIRASMIGAYCIPSHLVPQPALAGLHICHTCTHQLRLLLYG